VFHSPIVCLYHCKAIAWKRVRTKYFSKHPIIVLTC
jgi:hypothetical protein